MKNFIVAILVVSFISTQLTACAINGTAGQTSQQRAAASCPFFSQKMLGTALAGALAGGAIGALAASGKNGQQTRADVGIGIILGALAGGSIGKTLDQSDCAAAQVAMKQMGSARIGEQIAWANPQSGNSGIDMATSAAVVQSDGQICRQYHETLTLKDGSHHDQDGTTCRDGNGDWHAVS